MSKYTTSDCPVFITNTAALLQTVLNALCDIETDAFSRRDRDRLDEAISLLSLAHDASTLIVADIERGPEYVTLAAAPHSDQTHFRKPKERSK